jgi:H+/Cl- antiporter ClcA
MIPGAEGLDPGTYALIGSAAMLGGTTRMTMCARACPPPVL